MHVLMWLVLSYDLAEVRMAVGRQNTLDVSQARQAWQDIDGVCFRLHNGCKSHGRVDTVKDNG